MILLPNSNSDFCGTYLHFLTSLIAIVVIGDQDAAGLYVHFCLSSGLLTLRKSFDTSPHPKVPFSSTDRLEA